MNSSGKTFNFNDSVTDFTLLPTPPSVMITQKVPMGIEPCSYVMCAQEISILSKAIVNTCKPHLQDSTAFMAWLVSNSTILRFSCTIQMLSCLVISSCTEKMECNIHWLTNTHKIKTDIHALALVMLPVVSSYSLLMLLK